ncbi:hypothetical protein N7456_009216 [Penicillium angulare]|uniref:Uncharacterized protein n=1 Tax=Penicillium angulare TaxID=116970 RepID=A0A9W9F4I8_9EURO|nr:hypothetical protein N7456_009216 [Penicillium angulare]
MLQSRSRLDISIQFDEDPDFPGYYTNGDLVKGTATLTVAEETHVESVEICIEAPGQVPPDCKKPSCSPVVLSIQTHEYFDAAKTIAMALLSEFPTASRLESVLKPMPKSLPKNHT